MPSQAAPSTAAPKAQRVVKGDDPNSLHKHESFIGMVSGTAVIAR